MTAYISLNTNLCQACWDCVKACPNEVIGKVDFFFHKHARIDYAQKCKGCGACAATCRCSAIDIKGFTDWQISSVIAALR